jgi:hypothetical protein
VATRLLLAPLLSLRRPLAAPLAYVRIILWRRSGHTRFRRTDTNPHVLEGFAPATNFYDDLQRELNRTATDARLLSASYVLIQLSVRSRSRFSTRRCARIVLILVFALRVPSTA